MKSPLNLLPFLQNQRAQGVANLTLKTVFRTDQNELCNTILSDAANLRRVFRGMDKKTKSAKMTFFKITDDPNIKCEKSINAHDSLFQFKRVARKCEKI